ncbi:MAG TPA: cell division protein ZapA [Bacteroidetes bacterium]|nr:cell division protein ZapA [Bacteroidota bacterium]
MSGNGRVVKVMIFGQEYPIRARVEDDEYVRTIARYVDAKMREIDESMKPSSSMKVAILTALNLADELFTLQEEQNRLIAEYQEKVREYTEALDRSLKE